MPVITDQDVNSQLEAAANAPAKDDAPHPLAAPAKEPSFLERWGTPVAHATTALIDGAVSAAEDPEYSPLGNKLRDVAAGAITGATNTADAVVSAGKTMAPTMMGPDVGALLNSPIWDHAKRHILDFRDAVAVKDPSIGDSLLQGVAQLAIPFAGYSRALAGVHGLANAIAAGGITDATALAPHDGRMADLFALGRTVEGKLGDTLRALSPNGSALNAYIRYLTERKNESEAEGRFKNVLDGLGVNLITTPLLLGAASVLKQGQTGLRAMMGAGVRSAQDLMPPPAPAAVGK